MTPQHEIMEAAKEAGLYMTSPERIAAVEKLVAIIERRNSDRIESLERQLAERDAEIARDVSLLKEVHLINDTYKRIRSERQFAIDDIEYDLFSAGWKAAVDLIVKPGEQ